jgi:hypothetical protein
MFIYLFIYIIYYVIMFIMSDVYIRSNFFALKLTLRLLGGVAGILIYFLNFVDCGTYLFACLVF